MPNMYTSSSELPGSHLFDGDKRQHVLTMIRQTEDLPVPEAVLNSLYRIREKLGSDSRIGSSLPLYDRSVLALLLKTIFEDARSAGFASDIRSIADISGYLGPERLEEKISEMTPMDPFDEVEEMEWKHTISVYLLVTMLIRESELKLPLLPLAALLHDIGGIMLRRIDREKYRQIFSYAVQNKLPLSRCEHTFLRISHGEAGALLLKRWLFPAGIWKIVMNHHAEKVPLEYPVECALLRFADWIDLSSRGLANEELDLAFLEEAGVEDVDLRYWIGNHRNEVLPLTDRIFQYPGVINPDLTIPERSIL